MAHNSKTVRIVLHGRLRRRFGAEYNLGVTTPAAAAYALTKLVPGFGEELALGQYRVRRGKFRGGVDLPVNGLALRLPPGGEMHIIPCAAGAKGGAGKIIVGVVLVIAAIVLMQPEIGAEAGVTAAAGAGASTAVIAGSFTVGDLALAGGALILSGILQMISPQPRPNGTITSFLLSGLGNTSAQGVPVPLPYGRARVGSVTVSAGYSAEDFFPPEYIDPNNPYQGFPPPGETFPEPPVGGTNLAGGTTQMAGSTGLVAPVPVAIDPATFASTTFTDSGGSGDGGGGKGGGSSGGFVEPDTLHSNAVVRIIDVLGEGPIGGLVDGAKSIFFNGTPLQAASGAYNFRGVAWEVRYGYPDQEPVAGFPASETSIGISRQVKQANPVVQRITGTSINAVRVTALMPAMMNIDHYTGNVNALYDLSYTLDVRPSGPGWTGEFQNPVTVSLAGGKASSSYERSNRIPLPLDNGADTWDIRMSRLTPDSTDVVNIQDDTYFERLDLIDDHSLIYPNTAYIAYTFDASLFGNSLPSRQVEIYGRTVAVPANYDASTGSYSPSGAGTSNGTWDLVSTISRPTSNPAWIMLDLLTNPRYGCGIGDAFVQTTRADLYQIAQYCDGIVPDGYGGTEFRYAVNTVFATQDDAYRQLQLLAAAFRGTTYWGAGQVVAIADMPRAPTKLVNQTNVLDGNFDYQGTSIKTRHNIINVAYLDSSNQYLPGVEPVLDPLDIAKRGAVPTDLIAFGCITRSLAHRLGKWALYTESNQTETATWKGGAYHIDARPGDIVKLSDPSYIGARMGGRLRSRTRPAGTNLIADSADPVFFAPAPNTALASTAAPALYHGTAVTAHTYGGNPDPDCGVLGIFAAAGKYFASVWVWIPGAFTGSSVVLWENSTAPFQTLPLVLSNADGGTLINQDGTVTQLVTGSPLGNIADLTLRDRWQRLACEVSLAAAGTLNAYILVYSTPGQTVYSTGWMIDPGGINPFVQTVGGIASVQQVYLDALFPADGVSAYQLSVVMPDGTIDDLIPIDGFQSANTIDGVVTSDANPDYTVIQLGRPLAQVPSANAEWIITDSVVAPREFAIIGMTEDGKGTSTITAINYEPGKFAWIEDGIAFDQQNYSLLPGLLVLPLPPPTNVAAMDYMTGVGVTQTIRVTVSWSAPVDPRITGFQVFASSPGFYRTYPLPWGVSFDIDGLPVGDAYSFGVRSVGATGIVSDWALTTASIVVDGKVDPPSAPTGLTAAGGTRRIQVSWTAIANRRDIIQYEIWRGSTSAGPGAGATLLSVAGGLSYLDADSANLVPNSTWYYWVRAIALGTPLVPGTFAGPAAGTTTLLLTDDLADSILNAAKFSQSIAPVRIILNTNLIADIDGLTVAVGGLAVNEADNKLYRRVATSTGTAGTGHDWVFAVDLTGTSGQITSTQVTDGAISTPKLAANAVTAATINAADIFGDSGVFDELSAGIATFGGVKANEVVAGVIHSEQLASDFALVSSAQIGTAVIESANIADLTVGRSNIAAGAITDTYFSSNNFGGGRPVAVVANEISITVTIDDGKVLLWTYLDTVWSSGWTDNYEMRIYRLGPAFGEVTVLYATNFLVPRTMMWQDFPGPGAVTYQLWISSAFSDNGVYDTEMMIMVANK